MTSLPVAWRHRGSWSPSVCERFCSSSYDFDQK